MEYLKEVKEVVAAIVPKEAEVTLVDLEGPEIAIYTKKPKVFHDNEDYVRAIAHQLKKKVNIRGDKSLLIDENEAREKIMKIVPEGAKISDIQFTEAFSEVVIEALKPGLVIGKGGMTTKEIILQTGWTPRILRSPTSPSEILKGIRHHLVKYAPERKKILQETAKKIYSEKPAPSWIRLTPLGGFRQVGRSCIMLETRRTKILLDCGINVAAQAPEDAYPFLDAIRFPINELDAVVLSHAHMDHCAFIPYLFKLGYRGPVYLTEPTRDLAALLLFDYLDILAKDNKEAPYSERDVKEMLKYCIVRDYREVTDIAPDMRLTFHNAAHVLGSASVHLHIGEGAHNLVYSLDQKTPITVFDKDGNMEICGIGKLVDREIKKFGVGNGFVEEAANFSGWKTIAFNPQTLKSELVDITSFIRHPVNEDLFEISTSTGRKTTVTGSHSVFMVKNGKVESAMAKDLRLGDYIIGSKNLDLTQKKPLIKLEKNAFALKYSGKELGLVLEALSGKLQKSFPLQAEKITPWIKDRLENGMYENAIAKKYGVSRKTVRKYFKKLGIGKNPRVKNAFPAEVEITAGFARFLGYFISEGSVNRNTVIITQYRKEMLEDAIEIIKSAFGINGKIVKYEAQFYSKQLCMLLKKTLKCGANAYVKRMPKGLALAPKEVISEFLKGYFMGDGSFRVRKNGKGISINAASKSKFLIQEIGFLLLRLGIAPTFEYNKSSKMHNVHVYGRKQLEVFLSNAKIPEWEKKLSANPSIKEKSHFADRLPIKALSEQTRGVLGKTSWQNAKCCGNTLLMKFGCGDHEKKLVESDLMLDEIANIRKVRPTGNYVYDFCVKGYENFLGGIGQLFMHNSADIKYGFTRLFNNVDINYPRIETLIVESTYGGKDDIQTAREETEAKLLRVIQETVNQGGSILVPVFAVGRAQELQLVIENFYRKGFIDSEVKVYVDGMTKESSAIHTAYPEYLRTGVQKRVLQNDSPFTSDIFQVAKPEDRDSICQNGKVIILASSGMLTGGASVQYFYRLAENPINTIAFVGYQGEGSLGRKIVSGVKSIPITDNGGRTRKLSINMRVERLDGFSGHSDRMQLSAYVRNLKPKPKRILTDHGEAEKCIDLAKHFSQKFGISSQAIRNLDSVRLK